MYTNGSIRTNSLLVTLSLWPLTPSLYNSRWWSHLERFCSQWIMFRAFKMYFRNLLTLLPKHPCFWSTCRFQTEAWIWGPEPVIQRQFHCTRFNSVIFFAAHNFGQVYRKWIELPQPRSYLEMFHTIWYQFLLWAFPSVSKSGES